MENRNSILIPIAIVAAGAMIAVAVYLSGSAGAGPAGNNNAPEAEVAPVTAEDHILGNRNAEVVVVEYSDLECPFCKVFHATMHRLVEEYDGRVAWVYRHYPIVELHSRAPKEAEASECAAEQGGNAVFWKFIDEVFETTETNNTLDPAELPRIARDLGLDVNRFENCLATDKYAEKIEQAVEDAIVAGARGTPYSVILMDDLEVPVNGAEPYETVKAKIDSLLD